MLNLILQYIWRQVIKFFKISYDDLYGFLIKNCKNFLHYRRLINKFFNLNFNFLWDYIFPIYDYQGKLPLNKKQLEEWAIMDTFDALGAKYDKPLRLNELKKIASQIELKSWQVKKGGNGLVLNAKK